MSIATIFGGEGRGSNAHVEQRIRLFNSFLQHLLTNDVLFKDHVLHLFLTKTDASWKAEALQFKAKDLKPLNRIPKKVGRSFDDLLATITQLEEASQSLESSQKSTLRRLQEIHRGLEGLGTAYNGFSLENAHLADVLDSLGEFYDLNASSIGDLVKHQQVTCEMLYELSHFLQAIKRASRYLLGRLAQWEQLSEQVSLLRSDSLQGNLRPSKSMEEMEEAERELSAELNSERTAFWMQISVWLRRLYYTWEKILARTAKSAIKGSC